jgi:hypothetical protein
METEKKYISRTRQQTYSLFNTVAHAADQKRIASRFANVPCILMQERRIPYVH